MQIIVERHQSSTITLEQFGDLHGLVMRITERGPQMDKSMRWYARFDNAEVKEGAILKGTFGNGHDPDTAMRDYVPQISGKILVIDAMMPTRREIKVPILKE